MTIRQKLINESSKVASLSQNYQDAFALLCSNFATKGTFIDIGCSTPNNISNVLLLLQNGWTGLGFDLNPMAPRAWEKYPNINVSCLNVIDEWDKVNEKIETMPDVVDYINIDVDGYPTQHVIERINLTTRKFKCVTIEHDAYRFGNVYKDAQRKVLLENGYKIVITTAAEDWYVFPSLIEREYMGLLEGIPEHIIYDHNVHDIKKYISFGGTHMGPYV